MSSFRQNGGGSGGGGGASFLRRSRVDERGEQQQLGRLVQQDEVVAPQPIVVHPVAVDLEGGRVVVLLLVEERGALQ